ncbi:MAG: glycosyltransferase family 2 protein [Bacteroidota bacterium]
MSSKTQKISALIITRNEIGYIERCIEAIVSFVDEIIVIDSFSTDGTFEYLANHPKVIVQQRPFSNFTDQKSHALQQASNEWVLFVDADEVVTEPLRSEILATVQRNPNCAAYWFYRKFMYQNSPLYFSGWQTDKNYRLFRKSKVRFTVGRLVHETLQVNGPSGKFKARLTHYCFKDYQDYRSKMLHYGLLKAKESFEKGKRFSYLKMIVKPTWKFLYNYVFRLGFLDLERGINVCYLNALSVYKRYHEMRRLETVARLQRYTKMVRKHELA